MTAGFSKHMINMCVPVHRVSLKCNTKQLEVGFTLYNSIESIGFMNTLHEDTSLEISVLLRNYWKYRKLQQFSNWADFDINDKPYKFSESSWFHSPLKDLCNLACVNLVKNSIVVITPIPGGPWLRFIPPVICNKMAIVIAYNHSGLVHYDATQG